MRNIRSEKHQFYHVISSLPLHVIDDLDDIIDLPDDQRTYETVKTSVLKRTGLSGSQRVTKLLSETHLGDLKPPQLLRKMQSLAKPSTIDGSLLQELWLRRLPKEMCNSLHANADAKLSQLAEVADRIWETYGHVSHVQSASTQEVTQLATIVAELVKRMENMPHTSSSR